MIIISLFLYRLLKKFPLVGLLIFSAVIFQPLSSTAGVEEIEYEFVSQTDDEEHITTNELIKPVVTKSSTYFTTTPIAIGKTLLPFKDSVFHKLFLLYSSIKVEGDRTVLF